MALEWTHAQRVAPCVAITFMKEFGMYVTIDEELLCEHKLDNERDQYTIAGWYHNTSYALKHFAHLFSFPLQRWKDSVLNIRLLEDRFFGIYYYSRCRKFH